MNKECPNCNKMLYNCKCREYCHQNGYTRFNPKINVEDPQQFSATHTYKGKEYQLLDNVRSKLKNIFKGDLILYRCNKGKMYVRAVADFRSKFKRINNER